jgi:membrane-associated phospholipid phosphatase
LKIHQKLLFRFRAQPVRAGSHEFIEQDIIFVSTLATARLGDCVIARIVMIKAAVHATSICATILVCLGSLTCAQQGTASFSQEMASAAHRSAFAPQASEFQIRDLPRRIVADQKSIWSFPAHVVRGQHWKPALAFVAATAVLVTLDPHDAPYFRRTHRFGDFNHVFSTGNTALAEGLFPVALYLDGVIQKNRFIESSALEAGEALIDSQIIAIGIKNVARRLTPGEVHNGDFTHTWFKAGGGLLVKRGSFPSGHSTGAFAIAEVVAERYHNHHWVPWIAYGGAGLIAFSRLTLQAHFPSDVFAGAVFGYSISRFVVLHPH